MKFIKDTTWEDVFSNWREREASNSGWIECATKIKGWPDWESWRRFTAQQMNAEGRAWKLFEFTDPIEEIPMMLIGPFSGWQSRVTHKNQTTFQRLLEIPKQDDQCADNSGIQSMLSGLPFSTQMIGLIRKDTNQIICIDGHHRAVAITLAKKQRHLLNFGQTSITIALADLGIDQLTIIDAMLQRGTSKSPPEQNATMA